MLGESMKKICLYLFSGTGMTEHVVNKLISELANNLISIDCFKIDKTDTKTISLSGYDAVGIAYPVHSFNAPKIVIDFVKHLPLTNGLNTFVIFTAGEEHIINSSSSDLLIKKLSRKGYQIFYNKLVEMPSNFIVKYEEERVNRILDKLDEDIPQIAMDIVTVKPYFEKKNFGSKISTFIGHSEKFGAPIIGKFFYPKKDCINCEKCVDNCPKENITRSEKSIRFNWRCCICMRCIYQCPENAISVRQPFKFIRFDEWYNPEMFSSRKDGNDFE